MRRKPVYTFLASLLLASVLAVTALCAEPELANGELRGDGVPEGWSVRSYLTEDYTLRAENGVVTLSSQDYNDLRLTQLVEAEPGTAYILTAEVSAAGVAGGRGACLSIDNFSVDGSYIYSPGILGSSDWQTVMLTFYTGTEQSAINVALRLGGYSEMSRGTARFRNVTLSVARDGAPNAIPLIGGNTSVSSSSGTESGMSEARRIQLRSFLHLFVVLAAAVGVVLLFGVYRSRETIGAAELSEGNTRRYFLLAVLAGLVLRSLLASRWGGHDTDMSCWMGWGGYIAQNGPATFYTAPGHEWYDYPPGYMLVLGVLAKLLSLLQVPAYSDAAVFAYMLPACAADIGCALLLMRAARREGFSNSWLLLLGVLTVFNPAAVVLSGAWGQIDSILTLFLLLSFEELLEDRRVSAGALYGLAIMFKWQALIYGPVLAAAYLLHIRSKRDAGDTVLGVLAALAVIFLLSLPFKGEQRLLWIVDRFYNAAGGYDYASVEAYNFLALLGGNWAPVGKKIVLGISYKTFGTAAIVLSVALSLAYQIRSARKGRRGAENNGVLYLAAGLCMYMIFTFGHYMHERYVFPVVLLLLFAFVYTRESRFLLCSLALSVILFLNEMTAMYVISNLASAVVRSTREHQAVVTVCSAAETLSFLFFVKVFLDHTGLWREEGSAHA